MNKFAEYIHNKNFICLRDYVYFIKKVDKKFEKE